MIDEGIKDGKYEPTSDTTLTDLKSFQDFVYRNFKHNKDHFDYSEIRPSSNKPASLFGSAKTHKFANLNEINCENLKLRPIVSTCGTFYYNSAKALAKYLSPLAENEFSIKNTLDFAEQLESFKINDDEILVSYDVNSLFTQIPLDETIDHIIELIYVQGKLPIFTPKLIFKRLLYKVTKGCIFSFNGNLYKQIDGCGMGNPLSPVLANIYMCKLESDIITPNKPPFFVRYVDDCLSKRKINSPDHLLTSLNSYHPNIKFTADENPDHFLDTAFKQSSGSFIKSVYKKQGKLPIHWKSNTPTSWKRNSILSSLHRAKRITSNWEQEVQSIKNTFLKAGYPYKLLTKVELLSILYLPVILRV